MAFYAAASRLLFIFIITTVACTQAFSQIGPTAFKNKEKNKNITTRAASNDGRPYSPDATTRAQLRRAAELHSRAVDLAGSGQLADASESLAEAINITPNDHKKLINMAVIQDRLKQPVAALEWAKKALSVEPANLRTRRFVCELEMTVSEYGQAVECYRELRRAAPPDAMNEANYGVSLLRSGKEDDAVAQLRKTVNAYPFNAAAMNSLGVALFETKRYEEAIEFLRSAVAKAPDMSEPRYNLGIAYLARRNRAGAMSQYRMLRNKDPKMAEMLYRKITAKYVVRVDGKKK